VILNNYSAQHVETKVSRLIAGVSGLPAVPTIKDVAIELNYIPMSFSTLITAMIAHLKLAFVTMNRQGQISHIHSLLHSSDLFTVTIPEIEITCQLSSTASLKTTNDLLPSSYLGLLA
jgi:hypothetical protein